MGQAVPHAQVPATAEELAEIFGGDVTEGGLPYMDLFTTEAPTQQHVAVGHGETRLQYTGHAGFLIESDGVAILVDPVIANRTEANEHDVISYSQLPEKIDYVCLTHNHSDHVNLESLLQIRHKIDKVLVPKNNGGSLADPSLQADAQTVGFNVLEVEDLEEILVSGGRILSIPFLGEHGDLNIRSKTAWFFELNGKKIYAGADSSNLEPRMYQFLQEITGDLDVLAIGMECVGAPYTWLYGALTTEVIPKNIKESRRLNGSGFEKASKMARPSMPGRC